MSKLALSLWTLYEMTRERMESLVSTYTVFLGLPMLPLSLLLFSSFLLSILIVRCVWRSSSMSIVSDSESSERQFRRRDRLAFMGRKAVRNAKAVGVYIRGGQGRKRKAMAKLVRRFINAGSNVPDAQSRLTKPSPPRDYLEAEEESGSEYNRAVRGQSTTNGVPKGFLLVLKNLRVFGHFDDQILFELIRSLEEVRLRRYESLFKVGEPDDSLFVVESGAITVSCESNAAFDKTRKTATTGSSSSSSSSFRRSSLNRSSFELKRVRPGESIFSPLSFIDYLSGRKAVYKTVSARAAMDSKVIRINFDSFVHIFERHPDSMAQVIQVMMVRLQRVTLLALHQYMGLGSELVAQHESNEHEENGYNTQQKDDRKGLKREEEEEFLRKPLSELNNLDLSNESELTTIATAELERLLGLRPNSIEPRWLLIESFKSGETFTREDSSDWNCLALVLNGSVEISQSNLDDANSQKQTAIRHVTVGSLLGQLQVLTGDPSFFTYTAVENDTTLATLSSDRVTSLIEDHPRLALDLAMSVIKSLSPAVRSFDFAIDWILLESGQALYRQGAASDFTCVVLSGRLRSVIDRGNEKKELVAEYGRGDLTGIVETLMHKPRSTTVMAVRDSEIAKLPAGLIEFLKTKFPSVLMHLITLLSEKLQQSWERTSTSTLTNEVLSSSNTPGPLSGASNYSTVAILPLSKNLPVSAFTYELLHALEQQGFPSARITRSFVLGSVGEDALSKTSGFKLSAWLAQLEDSNQVVLYQCEPQLNEWTKLCARHADALFLLVDPSSSPSISSLELQLESYVKRARKEMIFLHPDKEETSQGLPYYPRNTSDWLNIRNWISSHYHIRCPQRMYLKKTTASIDLMYNERLANADVRLDIHSDFCRLARMLTGSFVGLVLGGGGARGSAHVGMIKAIVEAGVPIDAVAGVSIGSLMGALWCRERDNSQVESKARTFASKIGQKWRLLLDLTYPSVAYFTGQGMNSLLEEALGSETEIQDLWLPFFVITTDITESAMRIHDHGSLWRYVRASMSLAGYLPPLCDPKDGHLLLDGGYVNNLPADVMRARGANRVLAVDVGAQDNKEFANYGDSLSGFRILWSRINPFVSKLKVPNVADIQFLLAYVSCVGKLERVKKADYCDYIRPPIDNYGTLQFDAFDRINQVGYYHGKTYFSGLSRPGLLSQFFQSRERSSNSRGFHLRRQSMRHTSLSETNELALSTSPKNYAEYLLDLRSPAALVDVNANEENDINDDDETRSSLSTTDEPSDALISDDDDDGNEKLAVKGLKNVLEEEAEERD